MQLSPLKPVSFQLKEVDEEFVLHESTGLDAIPPRFLKDAAGVIKVPTTFIINLSIRSEIFSTEMKLAKVKPLYKKKSILSVTSKILEKAVFSQLHSYLVDNNLLFEFQSGFRGAYSTDTCLIHLQDHIRNQISSGLFTGMVLLDIQKAFDSVDHFILCKNLPPWESNQQLGSIHT